MTHPSRWLHFIRILLELGRPDYEGVNRGVVSSTAAPRMLMPTETLAALPPVYMTTVVTSQGAVPCARSSCEKPRRPLSAVVDEAVRGRPSVITRHGKPEAVVLSFEEWERLSRVPSFGRLLMAAPVKPEDLPERNRTPIRQAESLTTAPGLMYLIDSHCDFSRRADENPGRRRPRRLDGCCQLDGRCVGRALPAGGDHGRDQGRDREGPA